MATPLSSSSVVPTGKGGWKYDVFLSFVETRSRFVDHLYADLVEKGARVFKYDVTVGIGKSTSEEVVKGIKESRFVVVVFSKYYAYSDLCLEELSTIMECRTQIGQTVLPVFYHMDPSDFRGQNEDLATAFENHERKFSRDKVNKWRDALTKAANLDEPHILTDNGGESAFKKKIVQRILPNNAGSTSLQFNSIPIAPASSSKKKYDVFLCFGEDTRNKFTDHLYDNLVEKGICVFKHFKDDEMQPDVENAIKESSFAVVVFSQNYLGSKLYLEELSTIMEYRTQTGQTVLPVYYHIDKFDVLNDKGKFAAAFKNHRDKFPKEVGKVNKWWKDLTAAANFKGHHILSNIRIQESDFVKEIVRQILLADVEMNGGKVIEKLCVFIMKEIGRGSKDTVMVEGFHDNRRAAVKCFLNKHHDVASKEIRNLKDFEYLPNIVRYYGYEQDEVYVYIAVERCICSLHDLILSQPNPTLQLQLTSEERESFKVGKPIGYPSPELLEVMRDTVKGLAHLHEHEFIHGDLKPQKVLICKYSSITAKVSAMGISKCLPAAMSSVSSATGYGSSGWQAPETLRNERQTCAVDLFSLGCLLFFCITGGHHPFGDDMHERDINIKKDLKDLSLLKDIPEAFDLVSNLIQSDPKSRPTAGEVYNHPLFWKPDKRLKFFHEVKKHFQNDESVLKEVESIGKVDFNGEWKDKVDDRLLKKAKYDFHKVSELIRLIRNKVEHFMELPEDFRAQLGDVSTGLEAYFRVLFPNLLMKV